jgi:hypothetical protein
MLHAKLIEDLANITTAATALASKESGRRVTPVTVGAATASATSSNGCAPGRSSARDAFDALSALGVVPCRYWGVKPPVPIDDRTGCPIGQKLCGIMFPLFHAVPAAAASEPYPIKAKNWFWPIFFVDAGSSADVTLVDLQFQGSPVWENGEGFGPLSTSAAFPPTGNYSFMPGLPGFSDSTPLIHYLANADGVNIENFRGYYVGVSIR